MVSWFLPITDKLEMGRVLSCEKLHLTTALLFFFPERMLLPHHQLLAVSKLRINAQ